MSVMRLGFVHVRESDLEKASAYYTDVMGLQEVARTDGKRYFKCWDEYDHHSVVVEHGGLGLVKMGYKVESQDELSTLEKKIEAFGVPVRRVSRGENLAIGQALVVPCRQSMCSNCMLRQNRAELRQAISILILGRANKRGSHRRASIIYCSRQMMFKPTLSSSLPCSAFV